MVDVVHQTLCFFLSFQTTLVQSVFCVHPHILLHSTSIPQHTATTTMPTVSPTTTQSLRSDTAIALFVCTPSTIPFCLLSLFASTHACGPHSCTSKHTVSSHLLPTTTLCGVCVFVVLARERKEAGNDNKEAWEKRVCGLMGVGFVNHLLTLSFPSTLFLCSCQHHHTPHSPFQPCALCLIPITTNEREVREAQWMDEKSVDWCKRRHLFPLTVFGVCCVQWIVECCCCDVSDVVGCW